MWRGCAVLFTVLLCTASLAGCSLMTDVAILDMSTVPVTKKRIRDHVASFVAGKDCSVVRTEQGKTYCVEDELPLSVARSEEYCYQGLAGVECYNTPDPSRTPMSR